MENLKDIEFNKVQGKVNRQSHEGKYHIGADGRPRNPHGRTGLRGQGVLGRVGPNHAADPIVTRWKRHPNGEIVTHNGKKVLQLVLIKRNDTGDWAFPGGMVDAGEDVSVTLKREFGEEALNTMEASESEKAEAQRHIDTMFQDGALIYKGYVDDPRNTDNCWMETVAMNFHDEDGKATGRFKLHAGDDAGAVSWVDGSTDMPMYASHQDFMKATLELHKAL
jgi:ADP-ribose pyrophosphatase